MDANGFRREKHRREFEALIPTYVPCISPHTNNTYTYVHIDMVLYLYMRAQTRIYTQVKCALSLFDDCIYAVTYCTMNDFIVL